MTAKNNVYSRPGLWGKSTFAARSKGWILQTRPLPQKELSVVQGYRSLRGGFREGQRLERGAVKLARPVTSLAARGAIGLGKRVYGGIARRIDRVKINRNIDSQIRNAAKPQVKKPSIYGKQEGKFGFEGVKKPVPAKQKTQLDQETDVTL